MNQSLAALVREGYLDKEYTLTDKAVKEIAEKKPKNAIILAAGYGLRMVPINREIPKGLIEVNHEPLLERLIKQLHEAGIHRIDVVVGFMKEQYEYLIDQYGVNLIVNRDYGRKIICIPSSWQLIKSPIPISSPAMCGAVLIPSRKESCIPGIWLRIWWMMRVMCV